MDKIWVVIPAAGIGSRMQSEKPKQYLEIAGKSILEITLSQFYSNDYIAGIVVVLHEEDHYWKLLSKKMGTIPCPVYTITGGNTRQLSVEAGLEYLLNVLQIKEDSWVMVHDAARPCISRQDINQLVEYCIAHQQGAILAAPVVDTLKRVESNHEIHSTIDRAQIYRALTPQMFLLKKLLTASYGVKEKTIPVTDEASVMEYSGHPVHIVPALSGNNIKVTTPDDLDRVSWLINTGKIDTGETH